LPLHNPPLPPAQSAVHDGLAEMMPRLKVTVDPVENRGFEYHTGISFTFFSRIDPKHGPLGELGRGGRYQAGDPSMPEPATGFTLYTDTILRTLSEAPSRRRVLVPQGADRLRAAEALVAEGRQAEADSVASAVLPQLIWSLGFGVITELVLSHSSWPWRKRS